MIGTNLDEDISLSKDSLRNSLTYDFNREITSAEACATQGDFPGALYHRMMANLVQRTLKDLER
jgi:hypothetical protein